MVNQNKILSFKMKCQAKKRLSDWCQKDNRSASVLLMSTYMYIPTKYVYMEKQENCPYFWLKKKKKERKIIGHYER